MHNNTQNYINQNELILKKKKKLDLRHDLKIERLELLCMSRGKVFQRLPKLLTKPYSIVKRQSPLYI